MNSYADEGAWEACEDPVRPCRECGEIYSEFALDFRPERETGCPNCYEEDEEALNTTRLKRLDKIAADLEVVILAGRGDVEANRKEWRACQDEMRLHEAKQDG